MSLTAENYTRGLLVDQELMAGVSEHPTQGGAFAAFVIRHETGEYLGYDVYPSLDAALAGINKIERAWAFERTSGCGDGGCKGGSCGKSGGSCAKFS